MKKPPRQTPSAEAVVYTRVSSDAQVDGTSLDTQRESCERCAVRMGLSVVRVLSDEGKSAKSTVGRVALAEAIALCERRGAALVVYKFDRLARNVGDAYQMRDLLLAKGCRIISATEGEATATPIAKAMFNMMATFAELDNDMRAERSRAGMVARANAGGYTTHAPFGMRTARAADGTPILEPGENAEAVRAALAGLADGSLSLQQATALLRSFGLPRSRAYAALRNPVYGGFIRNSLTGWQSVPAAFPGLVSPEVFAAAQRAMNVHPKTTPKRTYMKQNPDFPFARAVFCAECHKPVRGGWSKGRNGDQYGYYQCPDGHVRATRDAVHAEFARLVARLATFKGFVTLLHDNLDNIRLDGDALETARCESARSAAAKQTRRLANLHAALLDGVVSSEEYTRDKAAIESALAEAETVLRTHGKMEERRREAIDALCGVVADADGLFDRLSASQTKDFVRIVFGEPALTAAGKIEPPQDSVFQLLAAAEDAGIPDGTPVRQLVETIAAEYDTLRRFAREVG